jgi:hypothetical protein
MKIFYEHFICYVDLEICLKNIDIYLKLYDYYSIKNIPKK